VVAGKEAVDAVRAHPIDVVFSVDLSDSLALRLLAGINGGIFRDTALILEARHFEGTDQKETAMEKYREIISGFPDSPWVAEANAKVSAEEAKEADLPAEESSDTSEQAEDAPAPEPGDAENKTGEE